MNRTLKLLSPLLLLLLAGCQPTLGPGEEWYIYHNSQNSFAKLEIDGRPVGWELRPGDDGKYPLSTAQPHGVVVVRGSYTTIVGDEYGRMVWRADTVDPVFFIRWVQTQGVWATVESTHKP